MSRQFFVGGNFKMNPGSVEQKKGIINILNRADLDPSTGTCPSAWNHLAELKCDRGRHCTSCTVPHPPPGPRSQGNPACCSELLLQVDGRFHG